MSPATLMRGARTWGPTWSGIGRGRATRYGWRQSWSGLDASRFPMIRISEDGTPRPAGDLLTLTARQTLWMPDGRVVDRSPESSSRMRGHPDFSGGTLPRRTPIFGCRTAWLTGPITTFSSRWRAVARTCRAIFSWVMNRSRGGRPWRMWSRRAATILRWRTRRWRTSSRIVGWWRAAEVRRLRGWTPCPRQVRGARRRRCRAEAVVRPARPRGAGARDGGDMRHRCGARGHRRNPDELVSRERAIRSPWTTRPRGRPEPGGGARQSRRFMGSRGGAPAGRRAPHR